MTLTDHLPQDCRTALVWSDDPQTELNSVAECRPNLHTLFIVSNAPVQLPSLVRCVCLAPKDLASLPQLLSAHESAFAEGRVACYVSPAARTKHPDLCVQAEHALLSFTRETVTRTAFRATKGWHILAGTLLNLPRIFGSATIDSLQNACHQPVTIVGAGPALDADAPLLAEVREHFCVIACDAAWNTLMDHGIRPDLVVSTDSRDCTWQHLERGAREQTDVPVVVPFSGSWSVMRYYPGPLLFMRQDWPLDQIVEQALGITVPVMNTGKCVGNAAFELAKWIGAESITMIGFNLGFDGESYHPKGRAVAEFEDSPHAQENLLTVPGNDGRDVKTDFSMFYYLKDFEQQIAAWDNLVYNATTGGALIQGSIRGPIGAALSEPQATAQQLPIEETNLEDANQRLANFKNRLTKDAENYQLAVGQALNDPASITTLPFPDPKEHALMCNLLRTAENPALRAAATLSAEIAALRPEDTQAREVKKLNLMQYLSGNLMIAQLVQAVLQLDPARSDRKENCWLAMPPDNAQNDWSRLLDHLREKRGYEIVLFEGDRNDISELWLQLGGTEGVIMMNGTLLPFEWAFPGSRCIDFLTTPPGHETLIEQWLPGYEIVTTPDLEGVWRSRVPPGTTITTLSR